MAASLPVQHPREPVSPLRAPRSLAAEPASGPAGATDILGYRVSSADARECASEVTEWLARGDRLRWAACINPHSYAVASAQPAFRAALLDADWLLPDGAGILLAARILGRPLACRVTGSDLFAELHRQAGASPRGVSVFLLGSTEATLAKVCGRLGREHPGVRVAGTYAPPFAPAFTEEENEAMVRAVNAARADVLWVSMTAPKQELWIHQHHDRLDVRFAAAVGAVFDFYAGNVKRSHPLAQRLGLEWLPRLLREPRRLWRRTFVSAPRFLRDTLSARLQESAARRREHRG
jgi:N-acetylglucosaminyldiphosphoundecaprenol N-acetyl-beta-D-mannosaminyltransferase